MTNLTIQEQNFYNDLIQDDFENKNNSLISQFFNGGNVDLNFSYDIIKEFFQNDYKDFFENSIFLFNSEKSSIIGKYKDYFWYANEDGYISFIDTNFSNFLYFMTEQHTYAIFDDELYEDLKYIFESRGLNIENFINKYKTICKKNGYTFDMKWEYDEKKADEFDKTIEKLKYNGIL